MSKHEFELEVSPRKDAGKGASRRLRRQDQVPAIVYGLDKEPEPITIAHDAILHAADSEAFFSQIITLKQGKQKESVVIKDLQRHPAKPFIIHADFQRISADQEIHVNIPLHFINEEKCVGVRLHHGQIARTMNELEVLCLPKNLPEYIEVDMLNMDVGDSLHISDLKLPEGVASVELSHGEEHDQMVVSVHKMQEMTVEPEETEETEAAEEAADEESSEEESGGNEEDKED